MAAPCITYHVTGCGNQVLRGEREEHEFEDLADQNIRPAHYGDGRHRGEEEERPDYERGYFHDASVKMRRVSSSNEVDLNDSLVRWWANFSLLAAAVPNSDE